MEEEEEEVMGQEGEERRMKISVGEGRKLELDTAPQEKKIKKEQIGLSPQPGSRDAYRTHSEEEFFSFLCWIGSTMKGTREAKKGAVAPPDFVIAARRLWVSLQMAYLMTWQSSGHIITTSQICQR